MPDARHGLNWFSRNLIEHLPTAVYVCNSEAVVVAFNRRATELWGRTPILGDADQKYCGAHKLYRPDGTYMPHHETPMEMVLRTGEPARNCEVIIERPNGTRIPVLVNISPIHDPEGTQIGAVNCFQDLTAQKLAEAEREQMREELRQSQKLEAMGQLIGGMAHDFNNLLTPIVGTLDVLVRGPARDDREKRLVEGALKSADRAKTLVQRLLAFARRQPLKTRAIDIAEMVDNMGDLLGSTAGPQITLIIDIPPDMPPANADLNQLEMAMLNLCINARDAMPSGGSLTISASSETIEIDHPKLTAGRYIRLSIADTGHGMDQLTVSRAAEPFFSTKEIGKGTGLGLSMVDGLVAQLGGALSLSSKLGQGTTIELWLPVSEQPVKAVKPIYLFVPETNAIGRVLLVDDEPLVRASAADMLTDTGYEVVEAASAAEALVILDGDLHFDFLVTDLLMAGMTGIDLTRAVHEKRPGLRTLIISGFVGAETLAPELARLAKPFRQSELAASLADLRDAAN